MGLRCGCWMRGELLRRVDKMSLVLAIAVCLVMAVLSITGIWKANKYGVTALWMLIALQTTMLHGLTESYKAVVLMLDK